MTRRRKQSFIGVLIFAMILAVCTFAVGPALATNPMGEIIETFKNYLPVITNKAPLVTVFGVSLDKIDSEHGLDQFADAGISWTRNGFIWSQIETVEGQRNWNTANEQELLNAAALEINVVGLLEGTPSWALKSGFTCGAVAEEKFTSLEHFAYDLVKRYSVPPYNVRYWELWNEPDAAGILGCWGDPTDSQYYGGYYYGRMLQAVYTQIKAADPYAQVLVGGLLLDCDPLNPPTGANCVSSNFLTGILESGAGASFDGVAFHAYDYYSGPGMYEFTNWHSASDTTGPVAITKSRFLKQVMAQYGVSGKSLINTETAVFYGPNVMTPPCALDAPAEVEMTKVYHLIHSYAASVAEGFKGSIWYSAIGVRCSGLLNSDLSTKPAYEAYKFAFSKLKDASLIQQITGYDQVMGYEFRLSNRKLWVIWSQDGADHAITLPKMPLVVNKVGADGIAVLESNTTSITVGLSPYFIEFTN